MVGLICLCYPEMTCHLPTVSVLNSPVMYFVPGFEITIDHPHTDVVKCSQLVRGRGFFLCSLCPLLLSVPPLIWVGRGVKILILNVYMDTDTFCSFDDSLSSLYDKAHERHALRFTRPSPRLNCMHLFNIMCCGLSCGISSCILWLCLKTLRLFVLDHLCLGFPV